MSVEDDFHGPYHRLEVSDLVTKRRRIRLLSLLNIVLTVTLILLGIILIGTLIPRAWYHHRIRPYPENPCTDPFSYCPVLLISMDGFRHDYLELIRSRYGAEALPNFHRFQTDGVRAMRSINIYPTITLPNHHTLVTGLYSETHGVVGNNIRDSKWPNITFEMSNQTSLNEAPWLEGWPEPIWITLQREDRLTGSLLWPLTDGQVHGDYPLVQVSQFTVNNEQPSVYPYTKRVTDLLWWLKNPHYRLDLILAYFNEPDETGHAFGPDSEELAQKVFELDTILGQLLDGLEEKGLTNQVDIILTADHGMTNINRSKLIALDQYVDPSYYTATQLSTMGFLYPNSGKLDAVYNQLNGAHPHLHVYRTNEVPAELNFNQTTSRMPPLILIPDNGWYLVHNETSGTEAGNHGYPMDFTDMNAFFIARGPSFLVNQTIPLIHAVDIYSLMAGLLGIPTHPHNGSLSRIAQSVLKPDVAERVLTTPTWFPYWWAWMMWQLRMIWIFIGFGLWLTIFSLLLTSIYVQRRYIKLLAVYDTSWNPSTA